VRPHDPTRSPGADFEDSQAHKTSSTRSPRRRSIDVLVHAVGPIVVKRFRAQPFADYRAMVDGNLSSAVASPCVLPGMRARASGASCCLE